MLWQKNSDLSTRTKCTKVTRKLYTHIHSYIILALSVYVSSVICEFTSPKHFISNSLYLHTCQQQSQLQQQLLQIRKKPVKININNKVNAGESSAVHKLPNKKLSKNSKKKEKKMMKRKRKRYDGSSKAISIAWLTVANAIARHNNADIPTCIHMSSAPHWWCVMERRFSVLWQTKAKHFINTNAYTTYTHIYVYMCAYLRALWINAI